VKTEKQLRAALEKILWYVASPRFRRQDMLTRLNIQGTVATLKWALGEPSQGEPVAATLSSIALMQQVDSTAGPEVN
jgi:hypothetical protein